MLGWVEVWLGFWQQEKTDITVVIVATNVGASFSPNADRLQRRPLITKPNRMG